MVYEVECVEVVEFSASVRERLGELPPTEGRSGLLKNARQLEAAIGQKAAPALIATSARQLGRALLAAYPVPLAPTTTPDLDRGAVPLSLRCSRSFSPETVWLLCRKQD